MAAYCCVCRLPLKSLCSTCEPVSAHSCTLTRGSTLLREMVVGWGGEGLTWQREGVGGGAIIVPLWIMRRVCDPYLKVNVSSCPCHSPSQLHPLLHYSRWPWPQNNIHLNKPLRLRGTPTNLVSLEERKGKSCAHS